MAQTKSSKKRNKKMDPSKILDKGKLGYPVYTPVKEKTPRLKDKVTIIKN